MNDLSSIKAEALIRARRSGIESSKIVFSNKLEWNSVNGKMELVCAAADLASGKITIFLEAIEARHSEVFERQVLGLLDECIVRVMNKTLYAYRPLKNADEVIAWAKQYFETVVVPEEMHTTIAYSKMVFDWSDLDPDLNDVIVGVDTRRSVVSLGDEGAVVLKFKSDEITKCWQRLIDAGASWDYPSYQPHVTLTFKGQGVDLKKIKPYTGELIFGPEVFREIMPKGDIDERRFKYRYNEDEPRDEDGKWTDGGGSSGDSGGGGTKDDMVSQYGKPSADWKATGSGKNTKEEQRLEADNNFIRRNIDDSKYPSSNGKLKNDLLYYSEFVKTGDNSHWWNFMTTSKGIADVTLMPVFGADKSTTEITQLLSMDRGSGRAALEMITAAADKNDVRLQIDPVPLDPGRGDGVMMSKEKLESFYAGFGFKQLGERDEGGKGTITMVREPNAERGFEYRYNEDEPRDDQGRWTDGGGSSGDGGGDGGDSGGDGGDTKVSSASELFAKHHDPSITADDVVAKTPGAATAIDNVMKKLAKGVATNAPVDEGGFIQKDGTYTPERQALHQQILENIFSPAQVKAATPGPGEKPLLSVLGGRGGSGKSWLTKNKIADPDKAVYLNSDDIQAMLPGQKGWNAALYHEEASDITAKANEIAKSLGLNVIHDATMRSLKGASARVDEFKNAGYTVNAHYMFLPPHMSTQRGLERFMRGGETGRFVPPAYLMGSTTNEASFDSLKSKLDNWTIHENMGASPKLVAQSKKK